MLDILINQSTGDLLIEDGDFVLGLSDQQHQKDIILANKGEYKAYPEVGAGLVDALDDENPRGVLLEIKKQLEYDRCKVDTVKLNAQGKLNVIAKYKK